MILLFAMPGIISILIYVVIAVMVFGLLYWLITSFIPAPFQKYAVAVLLVVFVIILIYVLLGLVNGGGLRL